MCTSGITKGGIWRASYRQEIVQAIFGCSEEKAIDCFEELRGHCGDHQQFDRCCSLVCQEVRSRINSDETPDNRLRLRVLCNVLGRVLGADAAVHQIELSAA